MKVSNCCFVKGEAWVSGFIRLDYEKAELCPKCGEHCEYIEETDLNTINTENEQPIRSGTGKGVAANKDSDSH